MQFYPLIFTFHIVLSGIWLVVFIAEPIFKSSINKSKGKSSETGLISLYLKFVNMLGMIGAVGILITGILMVSMNPGYGFFEFSANHWLVSKQIVMVVILILLGWKLIPTAKKLRLSISNDLNSPVEDKTQVHENLKKLYQVNFQMNLLVLINFLMAVTRVFYT
jgi:hypothetical protein